MVILTSTEWSGDLESCFTKSNWNHHLNRGNLNPYLIKVHHDPSPSSRNCFVLIYSLNTGTLFFEGISFSRCNRSCHGGIRELGSSSQSSYTDNQKEDYWFQRIGLIERAVGKRKVEGDSTSFNIEETQHSLSLTLSSSTISDSPFSISFADLEQLDRPTTSRVIATQLVKPLIEVSSLLTTSDNSQGLEVKIDQAAKAQTRNPIPNSQQLASKEMEITLAAVGRWNQVSMGQEPTSSIPVLFSSKEGREKESRESDGSQSVVKTSPTVQSIEDSPSMSMTLEESRIHNSSTKSKPSFRVPEASTSARIQERVEKSQSVELPTASTGSRRTGPPKLKLAKMETDSSDDEKEPDSFKAKSTEKPIIKKNYLDDSDTDDELVVDPMSNSMKNNQLQSSPPRERLSKEVSNSRSMENSLLNSSSPPQESISKPKRPRISALLESSDESMTDVDSPVKPKVETKIEIKTKDVQNNQDQDFKKPEFVMPCSIPGLEDKTKEDVGESSRSKSKEKGKEKLRRSALEDSSGSETEDESRLHIPPPTYGKGKEREKSPSERMTSRSPILGTQGKKRRNQELDEETEQLSKHLGIQITTVNLRAARGRGGRARGKGRGF